MSKIKEISIAKLFISLVSTIIIYLVSKIILQPMFFLEPINSYLYIFIQITFVIVVFFISVFAIYFINRVRNKDQLYTQWLKNIIIYTIGMSVFLLLIWPGHFVWDELSLIESAKKFEIDIWHSYITIVYLSYALMLLPFPAGVVFIQILCISIVVGYLQTKIYLTFKKKYYNIITYIIFFLPAIIINNLYPIRLPIYSYVVLLFFTIVIFDNINKVKLTVLKMVLLYFLASLMVIWRSEGIIYLLFIPIIIYLAYRRDMNIKKTFLIFLLILLTTFAYNMTLNSFIKVKNLSQRYGLTIYVNPLSMMLQEDLNLRSLEKDLENIDKVLDVELLKQNPSYSEIPSYWMSNLVKDDYTEHLNEFKRSYINLILNNPKSFIKARMKTFIASSGLDSKYMPTSFGLAYYIKQMEENNEKPSIIVDVFLNNNKFTKPINSEIKAKVESILIGQNINDLSGNRVTNVLFWNFIPVIILLFIIMIERLINKDYLFSSICLSFFVRIFLIFITSPANYFMYFLPEYIVGHVLILITIFKILQKGSIKNTNENNKLLVLDKNNKKYIMLQAFKFFCISGIGWILDIIIYSLLCDINLIPELANMISSICSVTFVYIVSTRKTFNNKANKLNLKKKYIFYIIYQTIAITLVSLIIGQVISIVTKLGIDLITDNAEIIVKIIVTPFIMIINFIFMKILMEKI